MKFIKMKILILLFFLLQLPIYPCAEDSISHLYDPTFEITEHNLPDDISFEKFLWRFSSYSPLPEEKRNIAFLVKAEEPLAILFKPNVSSKLYTGVNRGFFPVRDLRNNKYYDSRLGALAGLSHTSVHLRGSSSKNFKLGRADFLLGEISGWSSIAGDSLELGSEGHFPLIWSNRKNGEYWNLYEALRSSAEYSLKNSKMYPTSRPENGFILRKSDLLSVISSMGDTNHQGVSKEEWPFETHEDTPFKFKVLYRSKVHAVKGIVKWQINANYKKRHSCLNFNYSIKDWAGSFLHRLRLQVFPFEVKIILFFWASFFFVNLLRLKKSKGNRKNLLIAGIFTFCGLVVEYVVVFVLKLVAHRLLGEGVESLFFSNFKMFMTLYLLAIATIRTLVFGAILGFTKEGRLHLKSRVKLFITFVLFSSVMVLINLLFLNFEGYPSLFTGSN